MSHTHYLLQTKVKDLPVHPTKIAEKKQILQTTQPVKICSFIFNNQCHTQSRLLFLVLGLQNNLEPQKEQNLL